MKSEQFSRRNFVKIGAMGAGAVGLGNPLSGNSSEQSEKLAREIFAAGFCSEGLTAETSQEMVKLVDDKLQTVFPLKPDIICLPETFPFFWKVKKQMTIPEQAEFSKQVIERFSRLAKDNKAWFICPVITAEKGSFYNSAVVIDRSGKYVGEYRKMHPTIDEMKSGISPGTDNPPVFDTDFGRIGIQICFDVQWNDGWSKLQEKGAEMIFWPSAFPGGFLLNSRAWQHHSIVVSATLKGVAKLCDVTGQEIAQSGRYQPNWVCASVNLERAVIHTWPYVNSFDAVQKKYGRKISIKNLHDEEITIIESRSPEIAVKDVLAEFKIKTHHEHIGDADQAQKQARAKKPDPS